MGSLWNGIGLFFLGVLGVFFVLEVLMLFFGNGVDFVVFFVVFCVGFVVEFWVEELVGVELDEFFDWFLN